MTYTLSHALHLIETRSTDIRALRSAMCDCYTEERMGGTGLNSIRAGRAGDEIRKMISDLEKGK
jgi:hypothetical protein